MEKLEEEECANEDGGNAKLNGMGKRLSKSADGIHPPKSVLNAGIKGAKSCSASENGSAPLVTPAMTGMPTPIKIF